MKRELELFRRTKSPKKNGMNIPITYHCMDMSSGSFVATRIFNHTTGAWDVTHIFNHTTGAWDIIGRKLWNK